MLRQWLYAIASKDRETEKEKEDDTLVLMEVGRVLLRIDGLLFQGLANESLTVDERFQESYAMMSRYLTSREFKRLKPQFQHHILKQKQPDDLIALLLYLSVNSELKQQAVQSILNFGEHQQRQLMTTIQGVESHCQQIVEFKKIVEKIETLQQDNQSLRASIAAEELEFQRRLAMVQELQACNRLAADRIAEYEEQRDGMYKEMRVTRMEEFLEICQLNKQQNAEIVRSIENLEEERGELKQQNGDLKKELKRYGETIQRQIKEIDELKAKYVGIDQQQWQEQQQTAIPNIPLLPLKENPNLLNIPHPSEPQKKKAPTDRTQCSTRTDPLEESFELKNNLNVLLSLNQMERLEKVRLMELERLKEMRQLQQQREKRLTRKLVKLMSCHRNFSAHSPLLINP